MGRGPRPSGGRCPGAHSRRSGAGDRDRERGAHRSLRARRRRGPPWASGAGTPGGCHRGARLGKSDASRGRDSGRGRPAGDRGGRGALRGSAGGDARRREDSASARRADTAGCSRRDPDRRRDRGQRAASTTGRPACGGSPWPRGPGDGRSAVDKSAGVCDNSGKPPTPPVGWVRPRARRFQLWALTFSPPGSRHPTRELADLPLCIRLGVQIYPGLGERQHLMVGSNPIDQLQKRTSANLHVRKTGKRLTRGRKHTRDGPKFPEKSPGERSYILLRDSVRQEELEELFFAAGRLLALKKATPQPCATTCVINHEFSQGVEKNADPQARIGAQSALAALGSPSIIRHAELLSPRAPFSFLIGCTTNLLSRQYNCGRCSERPLADRSPRGPARGELRGRKPRRWLPGNPWRAPTLPQDRRTAAGGPWVAGGVVTASDFRLDVFGTVALARPGASVSAVLTPGAAAGVRRVWVGGGPRRSRRPRVTAGPMRRGAQTGERWVAECGSGPIDVSGGMQGP